MFMMVRDLLWSAFMDKRRCCLVRFITITLITLINTLFILNCWCTRLLLVVRGYWVISMVS